MQRPVTPTAGNCTTAVMVFLMLGVEAGKDNMTGHPKETETRNTTALISDATTIWIRMFDVNGRSNKKNII
jgi:hypothetical protein